MKLSTALGLLPYFTPLIAAQISITQRCATPPPPSDLLAEAENVPDPNQRRLPIRIDTYIHVVTTPEEAPKYDQAIVDRQIDVMNDAYGPSGVGFTLVSNDFTVNTGWANGGAPGSATEFEMKSALRQGTYSSLNIYFLTGLGGGLLGFCYFPEKASNVNETVLTLDGCTNLAASMPGGEATNYDLGLTAVHETGHWFGLFHVFQNFSCEGRGDYILDTPIQSNRD